MSGIEHAESEEGSSETSAGNRGSPRREAYATDQRVAVLPGDGIGPEVTAEAMKVVRAAAERFDLDLELVELPWSANHYLATGETLPEGALDELRERYAAIFIGAYGDPRVPDMRHAADILLGIRFGLDLYVNYPADQALRTSGSLPPARARRGRTYRLRRVPREHGGCLRRQPAGTSSEGTRGRDRDSGRGPHAERRRAHRSHCLRLGRARHGKTQGDCMSDKSNVMRFGRRSLAALLRTRSPSRLSRSIESVAPGSSMPSPCR